MTGRRIGLKLFLEGIEVPVSGASVTFAVGQASIAYINVVPHGTINNIKPRTRVDLFALDPISNDYALLFSGEVFGFSGGKSSSSRKFQLNCIDFTSYWDNALTYFFNPEQSLGKGGDVLAGGGQFMETAKVEKESGGAQVTAYSHSTSSFYVRVMQKAVEEAKSKGLTPDLVDTITAIVKEITGVNDFFLSAENRIKINDYLVSASSGSVNLLLEDQQGIDWFNGVAGRYNGYTTLRTVIQDLLGMLFHDFTPMPFSSIVDKAGVRRSAVAGKSKTIASYVIKPHMYMLPPPMCNIFFPEEYSMSDFSRNFFQEPTRLVYQPEIPMAMAQGAGIANIHYYEPSSYKYYMEKPLGGIPDSEIGSGDIQVAKNPGMFGDDDIVDGKPRESTNGKKREQQFMTNEENMKGIIMSRESQIPASSSFRSALKDIGKATYLQGITQYLFYKKRFEPRGIQISSQLKMSVVPGFPVLLVDDGDAAQNIVAYANSVTHMIDTSGGGSTQVNLSYARMVGEEEQASQKAGEPLIPPWFKSDIFGTNNTDGTQSTPVALSAYYAKMLGASGSKTVNDYTHESHIVLAVDKLLKEYRANKANKSSLTTMNFIDKVTRRDYATMSNLFEMHGVTVVNGTGNFMEFFSQRLFGNTGAADATQVQLRRAVIKKYRDALKADRGFKG